MTAHLPLRPTPPAHICGKLRRETPEAIKRERIAWVASLPPHLQILDVAALLGVSPSQAGVICAKAGKPSRPTSRKSIRTRGLEWGHVSPAVMDMDRAHQDRIEAHAARHGLTMAEAMADMLREVLA